MDKNIPAAESSEKSANITQAKRYFLKRWWWFAISLFFFLGIGLFYLKTTNPVYETFGSIMFNQNEEGESPSNGMLSSLMSAFSIGSSMQGVVLENEIFKIQSHTAIRNVVKELDLNRCYSSKTSIFRRKTDYFQNSPITVETPSGMLDTISQPTNFTLKISNKGKKMHLKVKQGTYKTVFNQEIPGLPFAVKTPLGVFTLTATRYYQPQTDMTFKAGLYNSDEYATELFTKIDVFTAVKKSDAVKIKVEDSNTRRAKAIVTALVENYNLESIRDRSAQSQATLDFLNSRLLKMSSDLASSEQGIARYKEQNKIVSPEVEAEYIFKLKGQADGSLIQTEAQLGILRMLKDFLTSAKNDHALIPLTSISTGVDGADGVNAAINNYNELVLQLITLQSNAKGNNATLRQLESQISAMRSNMITTLDRAIAATQITARRLSSENGGINARLSSMPRIERQLTDLYRDSEIKNRIYIYLLQKREETEIKLARVLPQGKIIDEAYTDIEPISPKKWLMLAAMALIGFLIPFCVLYFNYSRLSKPAMLTIPDPGKSAEQEIKDLTY